MRKTEPQDFSHHESMEEVQKLIKTIHFDRYAIEAFYELSNEAGSNRDQNGFKATDGRRVFLTKLKLEYSLIIRNLYDS